MQLAMKYPEDYSINPFFSIYNTQLFVGVNKELSSGYKNVDYGICSKRNRRTETKAD